MAIYHLSVKPVGRGAGRSATAAAAYRAGEAVLDEASGQVFDYTRRGGVEHAEIVLPREAAQADINWARDRQALWNAAEAAERRRDARVAREYEIALPCELSDAERVALAQRFSQQLADRFGCAVDFAVHAPHREGDERNHHAHLLATTRQVRAGGLGEKCDIELKDSDRAKKGLGPAKQEISAIRAQWAGLANEALRERGHEARVDHRSLEAQGIDRVPTTHLGPAVASLERRGVATRVGGRIREQRAAEVMARLAAAKELGRIEREAKEVERSILDLSGNVGAALKERDGKRAGGGRGGGQSLADRFRVRVAARSGEIGQAMGEARERERELAQWQEAERAQRAAREQEAQQSQQREPGQNKTAAEREAVRRRDRDLGRG